VFGNDALLDDFTIYSLDETTINARWIECAFCWNETIILVIRTIESDWFKWLFCFIGLAWLYSFTGLDGGGDVVRMVVDSVIGSNI